MRTARTPVALAKVVTTMFTEFDAAGLPPLAAEKVVLWALDFSDTGQSYGSSSGSMAFASRQPTLPVWHVEHGGILPKGEHARQEARRYGRGKIRSSAAACGRDAVWMQRLPEKMTGYNMMYLDDLLGATFLTAGQQPRAAHRTSATLSGIESRPQAHQRLCAQRFRQAGWAIAVRATHGRGRIRGYHRNTCVSQNAQYCSMRCSVCNTAVCAIPDPMQVCAIHAIL